LAMGRLLTVSDMWCSLIGYSICGYKFLGF
jgi:hypothetical protein